MMGPQVFQVLTEFRFDIGSAVASSSALSRAVGGISTAADGALISFQRMGMGLVAQMGLGTGGVLGLLDAAVKASDKFGQSQRQLANIFLSNNLFKGADAFENSMAVAADDMEMIRKKAQEFSLPASEMAQFTKLIGASLISHGLDDSSLKKSMDISRGFLKSAPTLGIDPNQAQGQLLDAVLGRASLGDTLFQRLMNETTAMKQFKGSTQAFNALPDAKRVQTLTSALLQFGSNAKVLEGNARSLTGEMQRLRDSFIGMFSILRPIGDAILKSVLPTFHVLNNFLQKQGFDISKRMGKMLGSMLGDPEGMLVNALQLRKLGTDVRSSGSIMGGAGLVSGIGHGIKYLGGSALFAHPAIASAAVALGVLGAVANRWVDSSPIPAAKIVGISAAFTVLGGVLAAFGVLGTTLSFILNVVIAPLVWIAALLQLISRAIAIANVSDAKDIFALLPTFVEAMEKLKGAFSHLIAPFTAIFDALARGISPIFKVSYYFDYLIWVIDKMGTAIMLAQAGFQGFVFAILQIIDNIKALIDGSGGINIFKGVGDAFNAGASMMIEEIMGKLASGDAIVTSVTNIAKVEINNQFKEQMEPDRIAFTLKDQLLKAAANRGQASGRSMALAGAGA